MLKNLSVWFMDGPWVWKKFRRIEKDHMMRPNLFQWCTVENYLEILFILNFSGDFLTYLIFSDHDILFFRVISYECHIYHIKEKWKDNKIITIYFVVALDRKGFCPVSILYWHRNTKTKITIFEVKFIEEEQKKIPISTVVYKRYQILNCLGFIILKILCVWGQYNLCNINRISNYRHI